MKRIVTGFLAICLMIVLIVPGSLAADAGTVEKTVRALGIMVGDTNGNMNLTKFVTRAEFVKMLVAASSYRDSVSQNSGVSPFKDVKHTHWAADYIKTGVSNGWLTGYLDGTFRPENTITLEEAASAILRLLGYSAADYSGTYPQAQISKFRALSLDTGISVSQGQTLTRTHCMYIFYNLMGAPTKAGPAHALSLGYTLNAAGEIDYNALILAETNGPYTLLPDQSFSAMLPFDNNGATVYRNDGASVITAAAPYDIYYYNENTKTVWLYGNHAVGVITAILPNSASPSSVTVSGVSYPIETSAASNKLSAMGEFRVGDSVALLLGMTGSVADVVTAKAVDRAYYGIVQSSGLETYGQSESGYFIKVLCTDGVERSFLSKSTLFSVGTLVSAGYTNGEPWVKNISADSMAGTVSADGKRIASFAFAPDVQILELSRAEGIVYYTFLYPSRLAGASLTREDIVFYARNSEGQVSHMILRDATGDLNTYGLVTSAKTSARDEKDEYTSSYGYMIDGKSAVHEIKDQSYHVTTGAAVFTYTNNVITGIQNLTSVGIDRIGALTAQSRDREYTISESVQIYLRVSDEYFLTTLSAVSDLEKYSLTGYYETGYSAGGHLRVIVAREK